MCCNFNLFGGGAVRVPAFLFGTDACHHHNGSSNGTVGGESTQCGCQNCCCRCCGCGSVSGENSGSCCPGTVGGTSTDSCGCKEQQQTNCGCETESVIGGIVTETTCRRCGRCRHG